MTAPVSAPSAGSRDRDGAGPSGWTESTATLSVLTILFATYGIAVLLTDDVGIVASVLWFFGLPVALLVSAFTVFALFRARRAEHLRGRRVSGTVALGVQVSCVLLAVLLGMGLMYFW